MPDDLYHRDIMAWSTTQADRLRRVARGERVNDVDWENVIEEVESLGRSELKGVKSLLLRALEHSLKAHAWPDSIAAGKWRTEVRTFLRNARRDMEPGMAQYLDAGALYTEAREAVLELGPDMPIPPRPLPERIALTTADLYDREVGPDELLARIAAA